MHINNSCANDIQHTEKKLCQKCKPSLEQILVSFGWYSLSSVTIFTESTAC